MQQFAPTHASDSTSEQEDIAETILTPTTAAQAGVEITSLDNDRIANVTDSSGHLVRMEEFRTDAYQGDMIPSGAAQLAQFKKHAASLLAGTTTSYGTGVPWPSGEMKYCFASNIKDNAKKSVEYAIEQYGKALPCLSFKNVGLSTDGDGSAATSGGSAKCSECEPRPAHRYAHKRRANGRARPRTAPAHVSPASPHARARPRALPGSTNALYASLWDAPAPALPSPVHTPLAAARGARPHPIYTQSSHTRDPHVTRALTRCASPPPPPPSPPCAVHSARRVHHLRGSGLLVVRRRALVLRHAGLQPAVARLRLDRHGDARDRARARHVARAVAHRPRVSRGPCARPEHFLPLAVCAVPVPLS